MRPHWLRVRRNVSGWCLCGRKERGTETQGRRAQEEGRVKTKAKTGVAHLQAKEHPELSVSPAAARREADPPSGPRKDPTLRTP